MKSQQMFLSSLLDFSNIPSKRATDYGHYHVSSIAEQNKSVSDENRKQSTDRIAENLSKPSESQLLGAGNDKLLKAFNALREKLSVVSRQNLSLKQSLAQSEQQLASQHQRGSFQMTQINQLSKKLSFTQSELAQYKMRLNGVKQSMQETESRAEELEKNRINAQLLREENKRLKEEIQLSMQKSIQQKLQLEQEIQQLKLKEAQQTRASQQAQNLFYQKTTDYIKLENQYKKLKLIIEQQNFMKNINSESILLQKENQELKLITEDLESKLKREKNKKYELETKLLELEEKVRLFGTRTDIYEGELQTIVKKIKKVQKDSVSAKKQANQALNQKLSWEEKFYHSTIILEELINRVKRQLLGDAVQLAKTCEFRLNKLKNGERLDVGDKNFTLVNKNRTKSSSKKIRSQSSHKKQEFEMNEEEKLSTELNKLVSFSNSHSNDFKLASNQKTQQRTVLKQKPQQNAILTNQNEYNNLLEVRRKLFNEQTTSSKPGAIDIFSLSKQRNNSPICQISNHSSQVSELNLEAKIRKERELMEKKLRQKILYHKIEDATSSPVKNKLREQYFNINSNDTN